MIDNKTKQINISDDKENTSALYRHVANICKTTSRENANVGHGPAAKMLQIAEETSKSYYEQYILDKKILEVIKNNGIYPHDSSWAAIGTTTCAFIPLKKLLTKGFNTGHGFVRSPKRIRTAAQLCCISLQANQQEHHGGQAFANFERDLRPSIKTEYEWQLMNIINTISKLGFIESPSQYDIDMVDSLNLDTKNHVSLDDICDCIYKEIEIKNKEYNLLIENYKNLLDSLSDNLQDEIKKLAWENTDKETYQAMEGLVFNLNTMHSRAGAQVPFSSINVGTDTSKEGRLVVKNLLLAYEKGLGKGEQPLFPNICFKVKSGVNYEETSPNFDLLLLALRVSSKRLFPTFNFQDATINKSFPEDVPTMGCRTRISWNRHMPADKQSCEGRGNLSFTTINLPNLALDSKYNKYEDKKFANNFYELTRQYKISIPSVYRYNRLVKIFFLKLNSLVDITIEQLLQRFKYQCSFKKSDFPFLMNGVWMNSEQLHPNSNLYDMLKHGTLGIGFIGLAETLITLVGKHQGEDVNANLLGMEIVKFLDTKSNEASNKHDLNFAALATPAEGLTGKLVSKDKEIFGVIKGVTDKEWYTNSYHIPVEFNINIFDKIKIEGAYSKYCQGGSITYVELNESPLGNISAYYKIIKCMYESDVVYGAINFPCDRCKVCGHFGVINGKCPCCGSSEISRVRRITGYLAETENFNIAKRKECINRVVHMNI